MNATGGFVAGSIVAKLLLDKTGWNSSIKAIAGDQRAMLGHFGRIGAAAQMAGVIAVAAVSAAAVALGVMVKKTAEAGDQLFEMSQKTGISVELLSSYKLAAEKAGSSLEGLAIGVRFLSRNIFDAGRGVKLTKAYFDELGVSTDGWSKTLPPVNDVLMKIADRFAGMQDGAEKSALAIKILGRSGTELIPFLNLGSAGLKEEAELAAKLGVVFTAKTAAAAHELSHTLKDLHAGFQGVRNTIANAVIPVANELGRSFVEALAFLRGKIEEFAASGQLRDWAIATAKVFLGAIKVMVRGVEILAMAIPSISAGISKALAATQDAVAGVAETLSMVAGHLAGVGPAAAVGFKILAATAKNAAVDLRKGADEQIDKAAGIAEGYEAVVRTLDMIIAGFGKAGEEGKKTGKKIKDAFDSLTLKNKLSLTFSSDVAEKIADITEALRIYKKELTPEQERKLRDELEALGEKFGFLKQALDVTFTSDVRKKIEDIQKAITEFQDRMTPETARALAEQLRHLGDETDFLRTELGLTFTDDVARRITDIQLALAKYKGRLTPEAERKLRDELRLLGDEFGFLKVELGLTFKEDIKRKIDDIRLALETMGDRLPIEEIRRLKKELKELEGSLEAPAWPQQWSDAVSRFVQTATPIINGFDAIFSQAQRNREIAIDNEYKKRLAAINASVKDETEKQKAIEALEAEYQIKRSAAQAAGAKQQKAIALAAAVMNVAEAITAALTMKPWTPFNFVLAGIVAALGAVQVALIAKQPIPLVEGATFMEPTRVNALTAENRPEHLLDEPRLVKIVREAMTVPRVGLPAMAFAGAGSGAGPVVNWNQNAPLIQTVGLSRRDIDAAAEDVKRAVDLQLRRVGRRI